MRQALSKYSVAILVLLSLALALFLRIVVPFDQVFSETGVRFAEADPYLHMRLVDNTLAHFPQRTPFDPYTYYPEGAPVYYPPLFTLFISGVIWLFSLGAVTPASIDVIGALFPAVLGVLTVIPVFFLGRAIFNKWVGVVAALLIAIMPGEFLGRTMLGFTDHHVAEVFFSTTALLFLVLALKSGVEKDVTIKLVTAGKNLKPLVLSAFAGLFLGLYMQMWAGGPLFILVLLIFFMAQSVVNHLQKQSGTVLFMVNTVMMLTVSSIVLPFLPRHYSPSLYFIALGIATVAPSALFLISRLTARAKLHVAVYPAFLLVLGLASFGAFRVMQPELLRSLLANFNILNPSSLEMTIGEVDPLLFPSGIFSLSVAWANFTTGFYFAVLALGILIFQTVKRGEPGKTLLVVWSISVLILTLGQRRFAYYYAVNVALLTASIVWMALKWAGLKEIFGKPAEEIRKNWRGKTYREIARGGVLKGLAVAAVFFIAIAPNLPPALTTVKAIPFAPDDAWLQTLTWLRENSPSPFGVNDFYYKVVEKTNAGLNYDYPDSAYGVMAWWDYGHWITRIARRLPNHAPGGGRSAKVARTFMAQDEETARGLMEELDSMYLLLDYPTAIYKFYAVSEWAGEKKEDYFDKYFQEQNGVLKSVYLFYPEYYQTLLVRLYFFEGKAVTPEVTTVINFVEKQTSDGQTFKEITGVKQLASYREAQAFIKSANGGNYRIVSTDPFSSPVPLAPLEHYRLVYRSEASSSPGNSKNPTPVKAFIYLGDIVPVSPSPGGDRSES